MGQVNSKTEDYNSEEKKLISLGILGLAVGGALLVEIIVEQIDFILAASFFLGPKVAEIALKLYIALAEGGEEKIGTTTDKHSQIFRVIIAAFAGGAGGGFLGAALASLVYKGKITQDDFMKILAAENAGISSEDSRLLWDFLCKHKIIENNEVVREIPLSLKFCDDPSVRHLSCIENEVHNMVELVNSRAQNVKNISALIGLIAGAASSGIYTVINIIQQMEAISSQGKVEGVRISTPGEYAGSIEAEAFTVVYNTTLIVYFNDGSYKVYISTASDKTVYLHYDETTEHYSAADAEGSIIPDSDDTNIPTGECFYAAIAYHIKENAEDIRQNIAKLVYHNPEELKDLPLEEFESGGTDLGGGRRARDYGDKIELSETDEEKALEFFSQDSVSKYSLKTKAKHALQDLKSLTIRKIREMQAHLEKRLKKQHELGKRRSPLKISSHHIHLLGGEGKGLLSVDVYEHSINPAAEKRGKVRMVFELKKCGRRLKYVDSTIDHNYKSIITKWKKKQNHLVNKSDPTKPLCT